MTAGEILLANSTLPSGNTAWDHLNNQNGDGGGEITINSEIIYLSDDTPIELDDTISDAIEEVASEVINDTVVPDMINDDEATTLEENDDGIC